MQLIIGLCGKAGSGKGEVSKILQQNFKTYVLPFAKPLKELAKQFGWDGNKDEKGRKFLQMLGTEIGRAYNPNHWVDCWKAEANQRLNQKDSGYSTKTGDFFTIPAYQIIVADDVRFDNEAECIKNMGGICVNITGRAYNLGDNSTHASEKGISKNFIDYELNNCGSLEVLKHQVLQMVGTFQTIMTLPRPLGINNDTSKNN